MAGETINGLMTGITDVATSVIGYLNSIAMSVYKASPPARSEGQTGPLISGVLGELVTMPGRVPVAED